MARAKPERGGLTPKQELFADYYVNHPVHALNGYQCAMLVGVPEKSACSMASQWLDERRFPQVFKKIREEFAKKREAVMDKIGVDRMQIIKELCRIAFFNPRKLAGVSSLADLDEDTAAALHVNMSMSQTEDDKGVKTMSVRSININQHSKLEALRQLGEHLGLDLEEGQKKVPFDFDKLYEKPEGDDPLNSLINAVLGEAKQLPAAKQIDNGILMNGNGKH